MKKFLTFILAAFIAVASFLSFFVMGDALPFGDIDENAWYYSSVCDVYEREIFNGITKESFAPNDNLTRAMFVTALARVEGIDATLYNWKVLGDVSPSDWYGPYVAWAYDKAITQSMGNDDFRPNYQVTREQIATFIVRYLKNCTETELKTSEINYNDKDKISDFAKEPVAVCFAMGLMKGDENGNFDPLSPITRAQAAAVISRLIDITENK